MPPQFARSDCAEVTNMAMIPRQHLQPNYMHMPASDVGQAAIVRQASWQLGIIKDQSTLCVRRKKVICVTCQTHRTSASGLISVFHEFFWQFQVMFNFECSTRAVWFSSVRVRMGGESVGGWPNNFAFRFSMGNDLLLPRLHWLGGTSVFHLCSWQVWMLSLRAKKSLMASVWELRALRVGTVCIRRNFIWEDFRCYFRYIAMNVVLCRRKDVNAPNHLKN